MGVDSVVIALDIESVFHLRLEELFWQNLAGLNHPETQEEYRESVERLTVGCLFDEVIRRLQVVGWYQVVPSLAEIQSRLLIQLQEQYRRDDIMAQTRLGSILAIQPMYRDWDEFQRFIQIRVPDLIVYDRFRSSGLQDSGPVFLA